jgi:hypothetical protein
MHRYYIVPHARQPVQNQTYRKSYPPTLRLMTGATKNRDCVPTWYIRQGGVQLQIKPGIAKFKRYGFM